MKTSKNILVKNKLQFLKKIAALALVSGITLSSCTKKFEEYNTNPRGLTDELIQSDYKHIGAYFSQMQQSIYFNFGNSNWQYQIAQNLNADIFSGYLMSPTPFASNKNNTTYFINDGWSQEAWTTAYNNIMAPALVVKTKGEKSYPEFYAISLIIKVLGMHRTTDLFGPIVYSQYGKGGGVSVAYDSQKDVYTQFFSELDQATALLKAGIAKDPTAKPFAPFDLGYAGDYTKWLRLANSLHLRLAMRIRYVDPNLAKTEAEKAVNPSNGGVIETVSQNYTVSGDGYTHPLPVIANDYGAGGDIRVNAVLTSILDGYGDPRLPLYAAPAKDPALGGKFIGIRQGIDLPAGKYQDYSNISSLFKATTPVVLMSSAEVAFLRAEGATLGWNMGGTPQLFYEKGIDLSFEQWGLPSSAAGNYKNNNTNKPAPYVDPKNPANNVDAGNKHLSTITIKWDDAANSEEKLERIITQKWIAMFPEGCEAWAEQRRTGYPKLFPIIVNFSGGEINSETFIRRLRFVPIEKTTNSAEVARAITLLGGPDNGSTKLWWDKK